MAVTGWKRSGLREILGTLGSVIGHAIEQHGQTYSIGIAD